MAPLIRILLLALACILHTSAAGSLFLAGGEVSDNNTDIYGGMVDAAGGHSAIVAVITAASADGCCDPDSSWALYQPIFAARKPKSVVWIPIGVNHTSFNHNPAVIKLLAAASLFFFSGGDQVHLLLLF